MSAEFDEPHSPRSPVMTTSTVRLTGLRTSRGLSGMSPAAQMLPMNSRILSLSGRACFDRGLRARVRRAAGDELHRPRDLADVLRRGMRCRICLSVAMCLCDARSPALP